MTPHISAQANDFAPVVLMPGDPLRAKYVAETFLSDVRQVSSVRNMLAYTGSYEGVSVSVMGSGMGIPSISIYARELYTDFGVEAIIRVGSCGGVAEGVGLRDIVIAQGASTDSGVNRARFGGYDYAALSDFDLLQSLVESSEASGETVRVGNIFSADLFYTPEPEMFERMKKMGVLAVEMEAAGLFGCAAELGKKAAAICTVSDLIFGGDKLTPEERERSFDAMIQIALGAVTS